MADYQERALAEARKQGLTAEDVRGQDYRAIAALSGVTIEANGDSPADFFYVQVRNAVGNVLQREEINAWIAASVISMRTHFTAEQQELIDEESLTSLVREKIEEKEVVLEGSHGG